MIKAFLRWFFMQPQSEQPEREYRLPLADPEYVSGMVAMAWGNDPLHISLRYYKVEPPKVGETLVWNGVTYVVSRVFKNSCHSIAYGWSTLVDLTNQKLEDEHEAKAKQDYYYRNFS